MTPNEQKKAAEQFAVDWGKIGRERMHAQPFWMTLLTRVFGIKDSEVARFIEFEKPTKNQEGELGFIDGIISSTSVIIEHKTNGLDLHGAFEQAKKYACSKSIKPRWIVTCNFSSFNIYDIREYNLEETNPPDYCNILLKELPDHLDQLSFLTDTSYLYVQDDEKDLERQFKAIVRKHIFPFLQYPGLEERPKPYNFVGEVDNDECEIYTLLNRTFYHLQYSSAYDKIKSFYTAEQEYHKFLTNLTEVDGELIRVRGVSKEERECARRLRADALEKYNNIIFNS